MLDKFDIRQFSIYDEEMFGTFALRVALVAYAHAGGAFVDETTGLSSREIPYLIGISVKPPCFSLAKALLRFSRFPFHPGGGKTPSLDVQYSTFKLPKDWWEQWENKLPSERPVTKRTRRMGVTNPLMVPTQESEDFCRVGEALFRQLEFI